MGYRKKVSKFIQTFYISLFDLSKSGQIHRNIAYYVFC